MGYKEKRQPQESKIIKRGPDKGLTDMSFKPSKVGIPPEGKVDIEGLLQEVSKPSGYKGRRYKGPSFNP